MEQNGDRMLLREDVTAKSQVNPGPTATAKIRALDHCLSDKTATVVGFKLALGGDTCSWSSALLLLCSMKSQPGAGVPQPPFWCPRVQTLSGSPWGWGGGEGWGGEMGMKWEGG